MNKKNAHYKICEICGKEFWVSSETDYVYKKSDCRRGHDGHVMWFCSYSCYRKYEKQRKDNESKNFKY